MEQFYPKVITDLNTDSWIKPPTHSLVRVVCDLLAVVDVDGHTATDFDPSFLLPLQ